MSENTNEAQAKVAYHLKEHQLVCGCDLDWVAGRIAHDALSAVNAARDAWEESSANWQQIYNAEHDRAEAAEAERDRARSLAATLEAHLAKVEALHVETACGCGCGEIDCEICGDAWPCQTIAALKGDA